uniref:Phosphoribosyltransferase domain-containing protein n=1 Tax=Rhodosorus marinus TaxID=101924 RepID=A0A7S2ZQM6_9RHOD|mmetsp:Transcript_28655/g.111895  ORF Transcript_28655/g.111895 Transcript_28655/m.111895 type:complete len:213 (+) Transcript_28655:295-933(+)
MEENGFRVEIGGVVRYLPKMRVNQNTSIAVFNNLGDTELTEACANELSKRLSSVSFDFIITPEAKSIPLAHAVSVRMGMRPYVVLRKTYKTYMGDATQVETNSITTGRIQTLFLDEKDRELIKGKPVRSPFNRELVHPSLAFLNKRSSVLRGPAQVVLLDDVISTGSTYEAMRTVAKKAGAEVKLTCCVFTEGGGDRLPDVASLGHLPVWTE